MRWTSSAVLWSLPLWAIGQKQVETPEPTTTFFVEGWGQAIFWSANIEYTDYASSHLAVHMRAGLSFWPSKSTPGYFGFPITLSTSFGGTHRAEVGAGFLYYTYGRVGPFAGNISGTLLPTFHAGYRSQHTTGGFFFRAGVMVADIGDALGFDAEHGTWGFNPYLCIGHTF
jgi:hypothetical protein